MEQLPKDEEECGICLDALTNPVALPVVINFAPSAWMDGGQDIVALLSPKTTNWIENVPCAEKIYLLQKR